MMMFLRRASKDLLIPINYSTYHSKERRNQDGFPV
jgi:hypothetical protein